MSILYLVCFEGNPPFAPLHVLKFLFISWSKDFKKIKKIYDLKLSDPMTSLIKAKYSNTLNWLEINVTTCICTAKRFEI